MLLVSETLVIGVDISKKDDESAVSICRYDGRKYDLLKIVHGEEALNLYKLLTEEKT